MSFQCNKDLVSFSQYRCSIATVLLQYCHPTHTIQSAFIFQLSEVSCCSIFIKITIYEKDRNKQSAVKPFQNQMKSVNYVLSLLLNTMNKSYAGRNMFTAVLTD